MFEVELFDQFGKQIVKETFVLPALPVQGQKISIRDRGDFVVKEVILVLAENSPDMPKYLVALEPCNR